MVLGVTMRPPYWNVFFKFCSHALAMPNTFKQHIKTLHVAHISCTHMVMHTTVCALTLILCPSAARGLLQVFQQEGLEDFRAAMESSQDVQQPPASLATIAAQHKSAQTHSGLQARGRKRSVVCVGLWCARC